MTQESKKLSNDLVESFYEINQAVNKLADAFVETTRNIKENILTQTYSNYLINRAYYVLYKEKVKDCPFLYRLWYSHKCKKYKQKAIEYYKLIIQIR